MVQHTTDINLWPWGTLLSVHTLAGSSTANYSRVLRQVDTAKELRFIASQIALVEMCIVPPWLDSWRLPRLEEPSFWVREVLPAVKKELERRSRPPRTWGADSPISKIKSENRVEDVAERVTELVRSGKGLRGRCPLHGEQTGRSFYIWVDDQRWRCFGACGTGGDVVDLLQKIGDRGREA